MGEPPRFFSPLDPSGSEGLAPEDITKGLIDCFSTLSGGEVDFDDMVASAYEAEPIERDVEYDLHRFEISCGDDIAIGVDVAFDDRGELYRTYYVIGVKGKSGILDRIGLIFSLPDPRMLPPDRW